MFHYKTHKYNTQQPNLYDHINTLTPTSVQNQQVRNTITIYIKYKHINIPDRHW
jgi:hypothetical protein